MKSLSSQTFFSRVLSSSDLSQIKEIVHSCQGLSRTELANTICELFSWKRPSGKLKTVECRQFLENLNAKGVIDLPKRKKRRPKGSNTRIKRTDKGEIRPDITGSARDLFPLIMTIIETKEQRDLWYEYVDRYHYLGYQLPFGAQLRYFLTSESTILGCFQFSSPAWKMSPRDKWITWNDEQRKRNLQKIINNSRFLILPWVKVKNLASSALSLVATAVAGDWQDRFGYRPVLLETLVDPKRFSGTCYRAANWIHVGTTTGRGRMDRENKRHGISPKDIYLYPLSRTFREELLAS